MQADAKRFKTLYGKPNHIYNAIMRILLIEDDNLLGKAIYHGLKQEYATDWFRTAEEGADAVQMVDYDVIVLDINLPGMSGLEWLSRLRRKHSTVPVLLLTARDTIQERVEGLDTGADDYLVKPFDFEELLARIRALVRRPKQYKASLLAFGKLMLDTHNKTIRREGVLIAVSQKEFDLLRLLIEHAGECLSKERIEQALYSWEDEIGSNTVEVYISSLRRKFGKQFIRTVRNLGYSVERET